MFIYTPFQKVNRKVKCTFKNNSCVSDIEITKAHKPEHSDINVVISLEMCCYNNAFSTPSTITQGDGMLLLDTDSRGSAKVLKAQGCSALVFGKKKKQYFHSAQEDILE